MSPRSDCHKSASNQGCNFLNLFFNNLVIWDSTYVNGYGSGCFTKQSSFDKRELYFAVLPRTHVIRANPRLVLTPLWVLFCPAELSSVGLIMASCWAPAEQHKRWAPREKALIDEEVPMCCFLAPGLSPAREQPQGRRKQDAVINLCETGELKSDSFTLIYHWYSVDGPTRKPLIVGEYSENS